MTDVTKSNSLTDLAARIRSSHEAVQFALKSAVEHAMNTGDMLREAKDQLRLHGQWQPWIREHCQFSERTARLYMRLAKNRKVIEATGDLANLTLNAAARLFAPPKDDDEKTDDKLEKFVAEIRYLHAETKVNIMEMMKRLLQFRVTFDNCEEFKACLREWDRDRPEPTAPGEIELAGLIDQQLREEVGNLSEEDWVAIVTDVVCSRASDGSDPSP